MEHSEPNLPLDLVSLVVDELAVVGARGCLDGFVHPTAAGGRREGCRTHRVSEIGLDPAGVHRDRDYAGYVAGELSVTRGREDVSDCVVVRE